MSEGTRSGEARTATFETRHADARTAAVVADALAPDNTPQIRTEADGAVVRTHVERDTTGGLHASVDDYLVNLIAADAVVEDARGGGQNGRTDDSDTNDTNATNDTP